MRKRGWKMSIIELFENYHNYDFMDKQYNKTNQQTHRKTKKKTIFVITFVREKMVLNGSEN